MLRDAYIKITDTSDTELISFKMDEYYSNVTSDVSWKTFIGQTSGESYQFEWHGGGNVTVIIQPSERQSGIRVSMD